MSPEVAGSGLAGVAGRGLVGPETDSHAHNVTTKTTASVRILKGIRHLGPHASTVISIDEVRGIFGRVRRATER